jgi:hypothetical protein
LVQEAPRSRALLDRLDDDVIRSHVRTGCRGNGLLEGLLFLTVELRHCPGQKHYQLDFFGQNNLRSVVAVRYAGLSREATCAGNRTHFLGILADICSTFWILSHLSHEAALNADATYPGSHLVQPEAPADEKVPGVQSEHADTDVEPSVAAYVPPAQAVLSFGPPAHQNPTGHTAPLADTDPGGQYLPASTSHSCLSCAPPGQKNPSGHVVPAAELPNEDPSLQKLPGAAVHFVHCGAPEIEMHPLWYSPALQPGPHVMQGSDPALVLNVPGKHAAHVEEAAPEKEPAAHSCLS